MKIINKDCSIAMDFDTVNKIYCIKDEKTCTVSLYLDDILFQTEYLSKDYIVKDVRMNNLVIQLTSLQSLIKLNSAKFINKVVYISHSDIQIGTVGEFVNLFIDPEDKYTKINFMEDINNQEYQNVKNNYNNIIERML